MNDKQKAWGIGAAIIVIVALIFFFRGGSASAANVQNVPSGSLQPAAGVTVQNYIFNREPFVIPTLSAGERWQGLSAIGACCADCSGSTPRQQYTPAGSRNTYVFNEGNRGANIFNYFGPPRATYIPPSYGTVTIVR